ncbi:HAD family phosphatase [Streptococcus suis]|nr:HAD family phosphatase [Streptococcus suis]
MITTLILDMGNVLLEWNPIKYIGVFEHNKIRGKKIYQAVFESGIWAKQDSGEYTILEAITESLKLLDLTYKEAIDNLYNCWFLYTESYKEFQDYVIYLNSCGYKVYILSNTSDVYYKIEKAGLLPITSIISGKILSFEVKKMKPNIDIYQVLLEKYDLSPKECLFLDDIEQNVEAAENLGIKGLVVGESRMITKNLEHILNCLGAYPI